MDGELGVVGRWGSAGKGIGVRGRKLVASCSIL
jgi:hypothetical protein